MKWFQNLKISAKLMISFAIVTALAAGVGYLGVSSIRTIETADTALYEHQTVPISQLQTMTSDFLLERVAFREMVLATTQEKRTSVGKTIVERDTDMDNTAAEFQKLITSQAMKDEFADFTAKRDEFQPMRDRIVELGKAGNVKEATEAFRAAGPTAEAVQASIEKMVDMQVADAKATSDANSVIANGAVRSLTLILCIAVAFSIGLGLVLSKLIGDPLRAMTAAAGKLAIGDVDIKLDTSATDEIGKLSQAFEQAIINIQEHSAAAESIAAGNLAVEVKVKSGSDVLGTSMQSVIANIRALVDDTNSLSNSVMKGQLDARADVSRHSGSYRGLVEGYNQTLDSIVGHLENIPTPLQFMDKDLRIQYINKAGASLLGRSKKDLLGVSCADMWNTTACRTAACPCHRAMAERCTIQCENDTRIGGKLLDIACAAAPLHDREGHIIGSFEFVTDQSEIKQAGRRANKVSAYQAGEVMKITKGLENLAEGNLNTVVEVAPTDADTAEAGILFTSIGQAVEAAVGAIRLLVSDANMLSEAAVEGRLDTRADATKHQGDFRKIVQGVNDTLDAVVEPLKAAAGYIERIGNGEIPEKNSDKFKGDFAALQTSVNACIDAINGLQTDLNSTIQSQAEGDIEVRCSGNGLHGVYAELAKGVNAALDAINIPVSEAVDLLVKYSQGDLSQEMRVLPGKQIALTNGLNGIRANVMGVIGDIKMLSEAAVEGRLEARADATKHEGEYRKIVQGVNDTLEAVIEPLKYAAEYVERISQGEIPEKSTKEVKGDFNILKNNLNACIDGLGGLVEANEGLRRMAVNDYTKTVDGNYQGVFAEVANATNTAMKNVKHAIGISLNVAKGDFASDLEALKKVGRRSEHDTLIPAFVEMMEAINRLVDDAESLSTAAVQGHLSIRADATKHQGEYHKIVQGVNDTLDAVIGPVNEAAEVLDRVANKDLTARMTGNYQGDLAKIKNALNTAVEHLDDGLAQVAVGAEQVASASVQISTGSQSLSQGASEQASSLEEISSSLQEMSSMTRQSASNAQEAKGLAESARTTAEKGVASMERLSGAVDRIKASSDKTAKIVKTIDEIAFQTNLLALNAAVEAARAGDAGKGFAVVAEEVRNLAMRSAEAAKSTSNLIEESVHNAEGGVAINQEVLVNLREINEQVNRVSEVMAEIALSSEQQNQGIGQVTTAVGEMDQLTQQNAANSEESASAAEELSSQAEEMQSMVAGFQLTDGRRGATAVKDRRKMDRSLPQGGARSPRAKASAPALDPAKAIPFDNDDVMALSSF